MSLGETNATESDKLLFLVFVEMANVMSLTVRPPSCLLPQISPSGAGAGSEGLEAELQPGLSLVGNQIPPPRPESGGASPLPDFIVNSSLHNHQSHYDQNSLCDFHFSSHEHMKIRRKKCLSVLRS